VSVEEFKDRVEDLVKLPMHLAKLKPESAEVNIHDEVDSVFHEP